MIACFQATPGVPKDYSYAIDFNASERKEKPVNISSPSEERTSLNNDLLALTSSLFQSLFKEAGRVTIYVPKEEQKETPFRAHYELAFEHLLQGALLSLKDSMQLDQLADLTRYTFDMIAYFHPESIYGHEIEIVIKSSSDKTLVPFWMVGSNIGDICLTSLEKGTPFFTRFMVWDPTTIRWLTNELIESLEPIDELSKAVLNTEDRNEIELIIEKTRYLEALGLLTTREQWIQAAVVYTKSEDSDLRKKGLRLIYKAEGIQDDEIERLVNLIDKNITPSDA